MEGRRVVIAFGHPSSQVRNRNIVNVTVELSSFGRPKEEKLMPHLLNRGVNEVNQQPIIANERPATSAILRRTPTVNTGTNGGGETDHPQPPSTNPQAADAGQGTIFTPTPADIIADSSSAISSDLGSTPAVIVDLGITPAYIVPTPLSILDILGTDPTPSPATVHMFFLSPTIASSLLQAMAGNLFSSFNIFRAQMPYLAVSLQIPEQATASSLSESSESALPSQLSRLTISFKPP
ncbi:hypothetical protein Taro_021634 [Colocasia esculenta]|uniref:Uncharacterized protein n=1 Tax=Colocasia esculenta TaxID=4460 RepID=A0A843UZH8_COLES|nr:hypothetical protein [Colocasia esculenta]